jgi:hypothetical protein
VPLTSTPARIRVTQGVLADVAIRAEEPSLAAPLYAHLLPDAERWYVLGMGGFAAEATYARLRGGLAALLGRYDEAERHFEAALVRAEAASARPECARVLSAHGAMLTARGGKSDEARARELFARARPLAAALGLTRVLASIPAGREHPTSPVADALTLVKDGETWRLSAGATSVRLKDSRGAYVARLVAAPGREIHVLDMAGSAEGADTGDAGEVLDDEARAAYKRRLAELDDELREAEGWNDGARASRARSEIELLSAELSRAVGLGGRSRRVGSTAERARVAVTRRIRDVVRRVEEQSPELGRRLDATLKTGLFCVYKPI